MDNERRKERRKVLGGPLQGSLSLELAGRQLAVAAVVDVSPVGIGVLVLEDVAVGAPLEVTYRNGETAISWSGISIWAYRREGGDGDSGRPALAVGIQLYSPTLLHTLLDAAGEL